MPVTHVPAKKAPIKKAPHTTTATAKPAPKGKVSSAQVARFKAIQASNAAKNTPPPAAQN